MTVCNMSIEGGARAGMVAPDDTTFAYLEGRDHAPKGAAWERGARPTGGRCPPTPGPPSTRRSSSTPPALAPFVTWGTNPAQVARIDGAVPDPDAFDDPGRARGGGPGPRVHGPGGRHPAHARCRSTPCSSARAPTAASRTCGPPPTCCGAARSRPGMRALVVPGSHRVKAQAEAEGLDAVFTGAGFDWREPGCSMCLAMNPDKLQPGRAGRLHLQPQLRGPPGPRRAHPPGVAGGGRRHRGGRPLRHARGARLMERRADGDRPGRAPRPLRRRHRPDHPVGLAEAGRAHRLRRRPVQRVARRPRLRAQPRGVRRGHHPGGRPQLRHRLVPRARRVGPAGLRLRGRGLAPASATSSATTAPRPGWCRCRSTRRWAGPCSTPWPPTRPSRSPSTWRAARSTPRPPASRRRFPLDEFTRDRLLNGWDDIGLTLRYEDEIDAYEARRPDWLPTTS